MNARKDDSILSGAYVLNALDADEAQRFEAHMNDSEHTRNEVTELSDTAVLLGLAAQPVAPPASLKLNIMAQLASTPQLPREMDASAPVTPSGTSSGSAQAKAQSRWFSRPVAALTAVAAAVVLIVGVGVVASTLGDTTQQQAQADQLAAINSASDSQRLAADIAGGGTATLVWSGELKSAAMIVDGLSALPSGKTYELWYIDASGARPAGTFVVGAGGGTWRVLEGSMAAGDTVGVTIEPSGGSTTPTTKPIVAIASA